MSTAVQLVFTGAIEMKSQDDTLRRIVLHTCFLFTLEK